jgi:hypothetical protein
VLCSRWTFIVRSDVENSPSAIAIATTIVRKEFYVFLFLYICVFFLYLYLLYLLLFCCRQNEFLYRPLLKLISSRGEKKTTGCNFNYKWLWEGFLL